MFKNVFSVMQKDTDQLSSVRLPWSIEEQGLSAGRLIRGFGLFLLAFLVVAGLGTSPVLAQHEVTGTVTDAESGQTLPGVNVVVQGTQTGTTTRSDGSYTIEAPSSGETLVFSFVGYQNQEVPIDGRSEVNVSLEVAVTALDEVVVSVGYGQQTVETTTGSYSQISGEDLEIEPTTNLTNALKGTVSGLVGVTTSGRPGGDDTQLLVRGSGTLNNNSPLVVIDGVPDRQGGLARLNPDDIQNVSVLKDASAAIYGSRAANGVILVETKRGQTGDRQVSVSVEHSYRTPTIVPEMADAPTYMQMLNEVDQYRGNDPRFSQEEIEEHQNCPADSWTCHDTDWYGEALKNFAPQTTANAALSGGIEDFRYRVSMRGVTQQGILVNSGTGYDQLGFRSNLDGDVSDALTLNFDLHGRLQDRDWPAWTRGLDAAWELLQRGKPIDPAFWPNGQPGPAQEQGVNPVVADQTGYNRDKFYYFQSNLSLNVDIPGVEGWTAEGTAAYDQQTIRGQYWQKPWTLYQLTSDPSAGEEPELTPTQVGVPDPRLTQEEGTIGDIMLRATTRYETSVDQHSGSVLLGTEFQSADSSGSGAFRRFFPTDQLQQLSWGGTAQQNVWGFGSHAARVNFFGRANYNFRETYLLELVARYDGSYIFPEGDRFGFFPSVSAGWRLAQEDWFNGLTDDVFSRFKLRASYGQVGNDQVEPYQYRQTFVQGPEAVYQDGLSPAIVPARVPNEDITWEVATKFDVGVEGGVLDDRLTFDLAYYTEFRENILEFRNESVPQTAGFSLPRENIADVRSWGVDGDANYSQNIGSDASFTVGANMSWTANEVVFVDEPEGVDPWRQREGKPMDTWVMYRTNGIWNDQQEIDNNPSTEGARPGDIRFVDVNGDGEITAADRYRTEENGMPDLMAGLNFGLTVGQFDLRTQFQGAAQVRHYVFTGSVGEFGNYFQEFAENRWTPDNPDASGPRAYNRTDPYWSQTNDYFWRDAKYLRFKSARLSYSLPAEWTDQYGFNQIRAYVSGRNLFTITPLNVMDPEIRNGGAHTYPLETTYTMGLRVAF